MTREERFGAKYRASAAMGAEACYDCGEDCEVCEGQLVCRGCGTVNGPTYATSLQEMGQSSLSHPSQYRRSNHLQANLEQITGCNRQDPPAEVVARVREHIRLHNINTESLTPARMRECLKAMKLSGCYRWTAYLCRVFGGRGFLDLDTETISKLHAMFETIEKAYAVACPTRRTNFINYRYVVFKCLELCGMADAARCIVPGGGLKSRAKVYELDGIWKTITEVAGWRFIPTTFL